MKAKCVAVLVLALLAAGCTPPSVEPFYTEKDVIRDPGFAGVWEKTDGRDRLICEEGEGKSYLCDVLEKGAGAAAFKVHLMRIGSGAYADVYPEEVPIAHGFLSAHLLPVHTFVRIDRQGDVMRISLLDMGWVNGRRAAKQLNLAHSVGGKDKDEVVFTAPTRDLQALMAVAVADPRAFTDPDEWRRARP